MNILKTFVVLVIIVGVYAEDDPRCPENCEYQPVACECAVFFQCRDGVYSEYRCPNGLHFNAATKACDRIENAACSLEPEFCCECKHIGEPCKKDYIFQDYDRSVQYTGDENCLRETRTCGHGLVWNPNANDVGGSCDFTHNIPNCRNNTIQL
ncbi:uncharacterized protein LOC110844377 [Folsomia candida]|uniref:Putative endochitinase n=1 Tax=Folsomia candida TaxID=158441 RepID=A0A226ERS6_FOLCA|nr:uncharacterized protein LOC110844377 [Folsomia candida]OXA59918.1 putative endochitinase [Folsomia candida]